MNLKITLLALWLTCSAVFAAERIVTCTGRDFSTVQKMLDEGWTVKAQSSVITSAEHGYVYTRDVLHIFTLAAPPPEVVARLEAEKKAAWEKKRADWLAKQKSTPVEK